MGRRRSVRQSIPTLRRILTRCWPLIRRERIVISGSFLALFGEVGFRLLEPWPLKFVFDRLMLGAAPGGAGAAAPGAAGILDRLDTGALLAVCAAGILAVAAARTGCSYLRRVGFALAGSRILSMWRGEVFTHLQRLSLSFHSRRRAGDLLTRLIGDIGQVKEVAITAAMPFVAHALTLVALATVTLWMDWRLGLLGLAILPLYVLSTRRIGRRIRGIAQEQRERKGMMGATAGEVIGSIKTVQSLSLEDVHQKAFADRNKSDMRSGVKAKRLSARLVSTTDLLIALGTAAVLWIGARQVLRGAITPGDLIVFLAYLKIAFRPLQNMAKYSGRIAKAGASADRILDVLDTTPLVVNRPGAVEAPAVIDWVRFEGVTFAYEPGHNVIEGLDLEARRGEVVVLAGPSGAGKSTIASLLLRLYDPAAGRIVLDGTDARDLTVETLRRRIAVVPQENVLFAVSIRDNIAYGAPGATDEQVTAAARLAQAHDFIMRQPQGYDTIVGERGQTLSEGQRQRIAIARAAVREAPILLLDEPTSSLDNENTRKVRQALRDLSPGRICFIIAHDLSMVQEDSIVFFLDRGRVVETGTHAELLRCGGAYAAMHAAQGARTSAGRAVRTGGAGAGSAGGAGAAGATHAVRD
jgi:ATP-binding cassette subfamily B protein